MKQLIMESHVDPGDQSLPQHIFFLEDIFRILFISLGKFLTET